MAQARPPACGTGQGVPVLWLCGPAGVGKSTVSWQLYTELASSGVPVAFADTDQFGMCYPAPPGDPDRQYLKALTLGSVIPHFRSSGAQCVIVNGVLPVAGLQTELLPGAEVTICRLRADVGEVERRLVARHRGHGNLDQLLGEARDEARIMDQSTFAEACVDTTGVPATEVAALVRAACQDWPGFSGDLRAAAAQSPGRRPAVLAGNVLLITGPIGVGKSTIGFRFYLSLLNAGLTAGYLDLDQVGFLTAANGAADPGGHQLKARNLAAIWRHYRTAGATHLVATGPVSSEADFRRYAEELPGAIVTLVRLTAGPEDLRRRIMSRGAGGSWPQPGDPLLGRSAEFLGRVAEGAIRDAAALDHPSPDATTVDTTGRAPQVSAGLIASAVGWLSETCGT